MIYSAKRFKAYIAESVVNFMEDCKKANNRDCNTKEDFHLMKSYFPKVDELKNYGFYHYNERTKEFFWSRNKYI